MDDELMMLDVTVNGLDLLLVGASIEETPRDVAAFILSTGTTLHPATSTRHEPHKTTVATMDDVAAAAAAASSDTNFHRDYARALGEALRQAEESPPSRNPQVLLQETYRQLCHDCPMGVSSHACLQLGRILLRDESPLVQLKQTSDSESFVLTDRFVSGLLQALDKIERSPSSTTLPQAVDESSEQPEQHEAFVQQQVDQDVDSSLAVLAVTVFCRIPFKVLTTRKLEDAARYIGSFRGDAFDFQDNREPDDEGATESIEQPVEHGHTTAHPLPMLANGNGHAPADHDNLNEVWAEDSDDSDFEFESDRFQLENHVHDESSKDALEYADSWLQIAQAISNLLYYLTFTKLSSLSMSQWKRLDISNHLTQLSLTLLLEQPTTPLLEVYPSHHWQRLALYPIHYFRDATLHHTKDLLEDYLQFLSTFLQSQAAMTPTLAPSEPSLLPCSILGVSLLSALCSSLLGETKKQHAANMKLLRLVRQSILESSDELAVILELAMADGTTAGAASAVPWTFLSLWQVVVAACGTGGSYTLNNAHAQILLNSGMFRQWLQWWERLVANIFGAEPEAEGQEACRLVQESIFELCLVSPKILGKYSWRFPGFAGRVCSRNDSNSRAEDGDETRAAPFLVDSILWNLLASELADKAAAAAPMIVWRNKANDAANKANDAANSANPPILRPPILTCCQDAAWDDFQLVCELVVESISDWKRRRQENLPSSLKLESQQSAVNGFILLLERLVASPYLLSEDFMARLLMNDDQVPSSNGSMIRSPCLDPIQKLLSEWPTAPRLAPLKSKLKGPETEDSLAQEDDTKSQTNDVDETDAPTSDSNARKAKLHDQAVDEATRQLRKALKTFQSLLDSAALGMSSGSGTRVATMSSSKAD